MALSPSSCSNTAVKASPGAWARFPSRRGRAAGGWPQAARPYADAPLPRPSPLQLIDLSSPLILLSPEADKENVESPLLKF